MDFYRIKHKPTGLYYKPGSRNLTKKGKVYTTANSILTYDKGKVILCRLSEKDFAEWGHKYRQNIDIRYEAKAWWKPILVPRDEFEMEPVNI